MEINEKPVEIRIPVPWGYVAGCLYESSEHRNKGFRPILALHGWQDNAGTFARLAPLLASHAPILALDLPGHGRSSHYPPGMQYATLDYVTLVKYIMEYFKWSRVSLMGHSMGAVVGFLFAAIFPDHADMIIGLDILSSRDHSKSLMPTMLRYRCGRSFESLLGAMNQVSDPSLQPTYSMAELEHLLHKGSNRTIDLANCKYILERNVEASPEQPGRYRFIRDRRLKHIFEFLTSPELVLELAKEIRGINYLVVAAENSESEFQQAVIDLLRKQCNDFQLHRIPNVTHHLHLNSAEAVAEYIIPFLEKHHRNAVSVETSCKL